MMRVRELAVDLKVGPDLLLRFLRESGVRVGNANARLADADVARVRTRLERERRAGRGPAREVVRIAVQKSEPVGRRRRRRVAPPSRPEVKPEEAAGEDELEVPAHAVPSGESPPEPETPEAMSKKSVVSPEAEAMDPAELAEKEAEARIPVAESAPVQPSSTAPMPVVRTEKPAPIREGLAGRVLPATGKPPPAGPGGKVRVQAEGYTSDGRRKQAKKKGKRRRAGDRSAARGNVQRVMAEIKGGGKKRRKGKSVLAAAKQEKVAADERAEEARAAEAQVIRVNEFLTVAELADLAAVTPTDIVSSAFKNLNLMVTINQRLDFDQIELLLDEFGFTAELETDYFSDEETWEEEDSADLQPRPPVVTVMGHVDHGKTRLLDWIRNTNVVAGEAGGITQHIGAYHVEVGDGRAISFLDTPGHAAFTAMRARGADITDLVVLVVAADDAVMPQTREAISHAKNAGVPMVVAVNKIDLPTSDAKKVKQDLLRHDVTVEDFGGETLVAEVSAKTGEGMGDLLEKILLQAELLELTANPSRDARGTVVEAGLEDGRGPVATILVRQGTIKVGDSFVAGLYDGRVRALFDERGRQVGSASPGTPVQILGAKDVPQAGDFLQVMDADRAKVTATKRQRLNREKELRVRGQGVKLGDFSQLLAAGKTDSLRIIIKGDVDGSVQALSDALEQLSTSEVRVQVIHRGVGGVNESDIMLAVAAKALIIGFGVRPDSGSRKVAGRENVEIRMYDVIYQAVDDMRSALEGLLTPEEKEIVLGSAEVREIFKIRGTGTIAGSYVTDGVIQRSARVRLLRSDTVAYDGKISSLKRFKDDVQEVKEGFECGIGIANFNDVKVGDVIETYHIEEIVRTLTEAAQT